MENLLLNLIVEILQKIKKDIILPSIDGWVCITIISPRFIFAS